MRAVFNISENKNNKGYFWYSVHPCIHLPTHPHEKAKSGSKREECFESPKTLSIRQLNEKIVNESRTGYVMHLPSGDSILL